MTTQNTETIPRAVRDSTPSKWPTVVAACGFVLLYFATDFVAPNFASSPLPLPTDPAGDVRDWFAENRLAAVLMGACQILSVTCLGAFAVALSRTAVTPQQAVAADRARSWGLGAVTLMVLSSGLAWTLAAVAADASLDMVSTLRTANFITGGTAHVVALGIFVLLASRIPGFGKGVRGLAYVALVPCVLSLASLVVWQAAAFILAGRLLCMIWTLSAAVSTARRLSRRGRS